MNVASLVNAVEQELSLVGDEVAQLVLGNRPLKGETLTQTLKNVGITDDCNLTYFKEVREKGRCPECALETTIMRGVTIGAQHEGWGLKWNTCQYSCKHCAKNIDPGAYVNCCKLCRIFWHRS